MLEVLEFFTNGWHFAGLLVVIFVAELPWIIRVNNESEKLQKQRKEGGAK